MLLGRQAILSIRCAIVTLAALLCQSPLVNSYLNARCRFTTHGCHLWHPKSPFSYLEDRKFSLTIRVSEESNADNITHSPFTTALLEVQETLKERYFFPGHNGGQYLPPVMSQLSYNHDVPELDGLDNLHAPEGPLLGSMQQAAQLFGAFKTFFLVNGSTSGILIAILASVRWHQWRNRSQDVNNAGASPPQPPVMLICRDSHKSVYHGLDLAGCDAVLLPCEYDQSFRVSLGIRKEDLQEAILTYGPRICGLIVTRPSYQGLATTSKTFTDIIQLCHSKGIPVIVDEAHGSHLRFLEDGTLGDGLSCGADIVVQSTHKTLPALSQCAMLHVGLQAFQFPGIDPDSKASREGNEDRSSPDDCGPHSEALALLSEAFTMLTTTSPNALLLASLDACCGLMGTAQWREQFRATVLAAKELKRSIHDFDDNDEVHLRLLDYSKSVVMKGLVVDPLRLSVQLHAENSLLVDDDMCDRDGIYCELNQERCITYGIQIGSSSQRLQRLLQSMIHHSRNHTAHIASVSDVTTETKGVNDTVFSPPSKISYWGVSASRNRFKTSVPFNKGVLKHLVGLRSAETISIYPPGIPVVLKGELFTTELLQTLLAARKDHRTGLSLLGSGCTVMGCSDSTLRSLQIMDSLES